ncbi:MAG: NAD(P)H-hydrate dehydratase [Chloroflexota bacterium]
MVLDAATAAALLPKRNPDGHKGTFGTVVCVCGSLDYAGAALLAGTAAARAGAGLVVLAVPASLQALFAGRVPELVTLGLPEQANGADIDAMESGHALKAKQADALVVGCGLRESDGYGELVSGLMAREGSPMVVDSGALNMLAGSGEWWSGARRECVLTPHAGEFERLTGAPAGQTDAERAASAVAAAHRFGQIVVLKGARTVIADAAGTTAVSPFANPALATAGSGDVLAGTIGALIAQGARPFHAACLGVYLHGRAGERLSDQYGDAGVLASELPRFIAFARHELGAQNP